MQTARLGADDWEEILYALELKLAHVEQGKYDDEPGGVTRPGSETTKWAAHLRSIMAKIEGCCLA